MTEKKFNVGYGRPPTHSRFKPGTSGNPHGRPKRTRNIIDEVRDELLQEVSTDGNSQIKVTKQRLIANALVDKASTGDMRAIEAIMSVATEEGGVSDTAGLDELKILDDYERNLASNSEAGNESSAAESSSNESTAHESSGPPDAKKRQAS